MILEKTRADQLLAKAKGKHVGRPSGINEENYKKVKMGFQKGLFCIRDCGADGHQYLKCQKV